MVIALLAGCGLTPSPATSDEPAATPSAAPTAAGTPSPDAGHDCGESMIGGQLWQDREGGAGVYNSRHRFIAVQWPPGYTVDYTSFRVFNSFTLYDARGRKVADGGDTILVDGDWASEEGELFIACAVGRVVAAAPDSPQLGRFVVPVEWCVVWQGTRRGDRLAPNPFLVPDTETCSQFPIL
jgi:hypothetical protein